MNAWRDRPRRNARELARAVGNGRSVGAALRHLDIHASEPDAPVLAEALRLLAPRGNGDALVSAALLPLFIGLLGDWPGTIVVTILVGLVAQNVQQFATAMTAYSAVLTASVAIGSVFLVAVIVRIERVSAARARERREATATA